MAIFKSTNVRRESSKDAQGFSSPGNRAKAAVRRAAYVQPRLLLAGMAVVLGGSTWWAVAQGTPTAGGTGKSVPQTLKLSDLPAMVAAYGQSRAAAATAKLSGRELSNVTNHRYALTEMDITPGAPSDEREPAFSPNGDYIAFASTGADVNGDGFIDSLNGNGKYHIWVMLRNGRSQRQITGLGTDASRDQRRPAWSPDGNQLVYVDGDPLSSVNTQLFVTRPFDDGDSSKPGIQPPTEQRTFFAGKKYSPSWNSSGLSIAFAASSNPKTPSVTENASIFTVSPSGSTATSQRVTGDTTADPIGVTTTDMNPCFSRINQSVIFFSSDREIVAGNEKKLAAGRRIWMVDTSTGIRTQVSNPTRRVAGSASDVDDFPASSSVADNFTTGSGPFVERVAFQSDSATDSSDKHKDLNVWSIKVSTAAKQSDPLPALAAGSYDGDEVLSFDVESGEFVENIVNSGPPANLDKVEGVLYTFIPGQSKKSLVGTGYPDFLVSNRESNDGVGEVDLFDGATNEFVKNFASGGGLTHPGGLAIGPDGNLYVGSGPTPTNTANQSSNKVHRFALNSGSTITSFLPSTPSGGATPRSGSEFTTGEGITNGAEGVTFGPDVTGDNYSDLYVTAWNDDKVMVYDGKYGTVAPNFPNGFVVAGAGGLKNPNGLVFGPDGNLYVTSNGSTAATNTVLEYDGKTGAFIKNFLASTDSDLNGGCKGVLFGPDGDLYVGALDGKINRYDGTTGLNKPSAGRTGAAFTDPFLQGAGYLTFNPSSYAAAAAPSVPTENTSAAALESNRISSIDTFMNSGLAGPNAMEDTVADQEPAFGSSTASNSLVAQLAFASQRTAAASPNGDVNSQYPNDPVVVNPAPPAGVTANDNDIWTTATQDFTPPILVPQGTGNDQTPFIAPGIQAPFDAPRTAEAGLKAGGGANKVKIAFVLKEQESGLNQNSVYVQFRNADKPTYFSQVLPVNETVKVNIQLEQPPSAAGSVLKVAVSDAGPNDPVNPEKQAGAVKNDGIYYCSAEVPTPALAGDYYIDVIAIDVAGNRLVYDNIWGFSTKPFQKSVDKNDLLVSDYGVGQLFPQTLSPNQYRFQEQQPIESYYLTNPGDSGDTTSPTSGGSIKTTFSSVNVWRILCRGPVPSEVYQAFSPTIVNQYDPEDFKNGRPAGFPSTATGATGTFPAKSRKVAVAKTAIIWASPYTGTVFSGPGTLLDSNTQTNLSNFLSQGGRLFVSGRDVIYSLSNQGTLQNSFLKSELQASWVGEEFPVSRTIKGAEGFFDFWPYGIYSSILQFAFNQEELAPDKQTDTYTDAAWNQDYFTNSATSVGFVPATSTPIGFDYIGPGSTSTGTKVIPAYTTLEGKTVGQRVEKVRTNGVDSRVVFFSFGFEAINRRYQKNVTTLPRELNVRYNVGQKILEYFKTVGISGTVTDASTNLPIPNFIVQITGNGNTYIAVTDENGFYEVTGLPQSESTTGGYTVEPGTYASGGTTKLINPGYQTTDKHFPFLVGGTSAANQDFRMLPVPQGSLAGKAVVKTATGTLVPMESGWILLRSVSESSIFPGGGKYAQMTQADAGGRFAFPNVPPDIPMEVVLNPDVVDIPVNTGLRANYSAAGGPRTDYGKRIIPDKFRPDKISAPGGDSFFLNDLISPTQTITADTSIDDGPPIVVPYGVTVTGRVLKSFNGTVTPVVGATVNLRKKSDQSVVSPSAITDDQGNYSFYELPRNTTDQDYEISVDAGTVGTYNYGGGDPELDTIPIGSKNAVIIKDIAFYKQDILGKVSVTETNGDVPAVGAKIILTHPGDTSFVPRETNAVASGTDAIYSFTGVPGSATPYKISGELNGKTGSIDVTVTNGSNPDVKLLKLKLQGIQGKALLNGVAVANASIFVDGVDSGVKSGGDGSFGVPDAASGNHTVYATYNRDKSDPFTVTVPADGATNSFNLQLFLETLNGKVNSVTSGGTAVGAALADVTATTTSPIDGLPFTKTVKTDASGNYSFTGMIAGTYTVTANLADDTTPAASPSPVLIRNGATVTAANLTLVYSTVRAVVKVNGVNTAGATVYLLKNNVDYKTPLVSDSNGAVAFAGVAAGTYTLRAKKDSSVSQDVQVTFTRGNDPATTTLNLSQVNVSGRVLVNGTPTGGLKVTLTKAGTLIATTTTLADGSYGFSQVGAGDYVVTATTGTGGDTASQNVTVTATTNPVVPDINLLLQTVQGTVTIAGTPASGAKVDLLDSALAVRATTTTNASGLYSFASVPSGSYVIRAKPVESVNSKDQAVTVTRTGGTVTVTTIVFQTISGNVKLNGTNAQLAPVSLSQGTGTLGSTQTDSSGNFRFVGVFAGTYNVKASVGTLATETKSVSVAADANVVVNFTLTTTGNTPTAIPTNTPLPPTPTPDPSTEDYQINKLYEISVPYSDSAAIDSTTTVAKAFPLLPTETVNGITTVNYTLRKWDPVTQAYVNLTSGDDIIKRGEGYFIKPLTRAFSMKKPSTDPTRIPLPASVKEFTITLRKNPSLAPNDPNNGYNLIGFPFDPATYSSVSWLQAGLVVMPDNVTTFPTVIDAYNNNKMSNELTTLADGTTTYVDAPSIQKFKGYFVKTFTDGIKVTLRNPATN